MVLSGNLGFLGLSMTSYDLRGITKYSKLNTGKLPVNSRTAKPRKNRKHRTANREPQTKNRKQRTTLSRRGPAPPCSGESTACKWKV